DCIRDRNVTGVQTCALPILFGLLRELVIVLEVCAMTNGRILLSFYDRMFFEYVAKLFSYFCWFVDPCGYNIDGAFYCRIRGLNCFAFIPKLQDVPVGRA